MPPYQIRVQGQCSNLWGMQETEEVHWLLELLAATTIPASINSKSKFYVQTKKEAQKHCTWGLRDIRGTWTIAFKYLDNGQFW